MLGAVDSMVEREGDEEEPLPVLASWRGALLQRISTKTLTGTPFEEAVRLFEERNILPKAQFDALKDAAKQKAFTVAGLAAEELLQETHAELARQIADSREKTYYDEATQKWVYKGPNLREFDKFAKERLEKAGWTPASPSHVETILRTNVMGAYGSGRIVETTQPAVLAARPYWEIRGVSDSRQRKTHRKAQGTILAADHPFWRKAYPPFGYNCRCRVISRSKKWVDSHGGPTRVPEGLPDPGFASGIDASMVPAAMTVDLDGARAPTAPAPARPIDRPDPVRIQPGATKLKPLTPQIEPHALPVPEPLAAGIQAGKHAASVMVGPKVSKARLATVLESFSTDELKWLERDRVKTMVVQQSLSARGRATNGSFNWGTDTLAVRAQRPKSTWGMVFRAGKSWSVSSTRQSEVAAVQATARHELGHRMHLMAPQHIDLEVRAAFVRGNPITEYAASDHREYFAESYAMYRESPQTLKDHDPEGFRIVRYVLDHLGIPHGQFDP